MNLNMSCSKTHQLCFVPSSYPREYETVRKSTYMDGSLDSKRGNNTADSLSIPEGCLKAKSVS